MMASLLVGIMVAALVAWIARNTYWDELKIPRPPKGEALTNPFYAAQRLAQTLGARAVWDRALHVPARDAVIVVSSWHWDLTTERREALESWTEAGGRLVVDYLIVGGEDEFEKWSGIVRHYREPADDSEEEEEEECRTFQAERTDYEICHGLDRISFLTSDKPVAWALGDASGMQALRVDVGRGSVVVINATPFRHQRIFHGDHGRLFVAATQLRRGDDVHFLSDGDHPSLFALIWQNGFPFVVLMAALLILAVWRGTVRLGPLAAPRDAGRRSLAEQIRGTGHFVLRYGGGGALYAACVRALDEAAQRRIPSYSSLSTTERVSALAQLTGVDRDELESALSARVRRAHDLRGSIAVLEAARRRTLTGHTRLSHAEQ
ncbi:MAG TPA: hypothetical protein VJM31_13440 [Vicinamibacterales bacterium]|nr:hypothetical protein [Vicinamibacterales bacterium]